MQPLVSLLSVAGPISLIVAQVVMALLSKRLGEVTKRAPTYRWFFVSAGLVSISILLQLLGIVSGGEAAFAIVYDIFLTLGLALSVVIAWKYWSWLLSESSKKA